MLLKFKLFNYSILILFLYNMKLVLRTLIFHILCIIIFTIIYSNLTEEFQEHDKKSFVDFILLSTSIQSGVGISDLFPLSYYSKIVIIIQQLLMLFIHVITLYIFTL
jgi:hypothetical protein